MPISKAGAGLALAAGLAACAEVPRDVGGVRGFSGREAELERRHGDMVLAALGPARAEISAAGAPITVAAPEGRCLVEDGAETSPSAVVVAIAGCEGGAKGLTLVSVAREPMFEDGRSKAAALRELGDFIGSVAGRRMLARNGAASRAEMRELRQIGDALYVRVHEAEGAPAILAPDYWRAFFEVGGRLVVVTQSAFAGAEMPAGAALAQAAAQVAAIRAANGAPGFDEELRLADAAGGADEAAPSDPSAGIAEIRRQVASRAPGPNRAPAPLPAPRG